MDFQKQAFIANNKSSVRALIETFFDGDYEYHINISNLKGFAPMDFDIYQMIRNNRSLIDKYYSGEF